MAGVRQLAERTPASRERVVDFLRAWAIVTVVFGHWLLIVVEYAGGRRLVGHSALQDVPWWAPLTWPMQVLPLFFLVGGFANAASLAGHRERGGDAVGWLVERGDRLLRPTVVLLVVLVVGAGVARLAGAGASQVRMAVWFASIPLWFLSAYLVAVLLTPLMLGLHRRFGLLVPVVLVGLVAVGDLARFGVLPRGLANGNLVFGWLAVHQLGFAWWDGRLRARRWVGWGLLAGGLVAAVVAVTVGPYPVSMVNVPGERVHNMSPPSVALLALSAAQVGLVLVARDRLDGWLRRDRRVWTAVVAVNAVIMTVFLWHVTAALLVAGGLAVAGVLPTPPVGTVSWFAWRVPWLALLTVTLGVLVAVFGWVEARGRRALRWPRVLPGGWAAALRRRGVRWPLTVAGFGLAVAGLVGDNTAGHSSPLPLGMPVAALAAFLAGVVLVGAVRSAGAARPR